MSNTQFWLNMECLRRTGERVDRLVGDDGVARALAHVCLTRLRLLVREPPARVLPATTWLNNAVHLGAEPVVVGEPDVYGPGDRQCVQKLPRRRAANRVAVCVRESTSESGALGENAAVLAELSEPRQRQFDLCTGLIRVQKPYVGRKT